jgi:enhancer of polycomb-like protein
MFAIERQIFVQRSEVNEMKRKLGIKDDDEDLINQKVGRHLAVTTDAIANAEQPKKKPVDVPTIQRPIPAQLRVPQRPGAQAAEDLQLLEDVQAEKENEILRDIKQNLAKHIKWNEGYVDFTRAPLSPSPERTFEAGFRPAITTQLPTPPSSESSEDVHMNDSPMVDHGLVYLNKFAPHAMDVDEDTSRIPSFRRRIGRGGRLMIDRRNLASRCRVEMDPLITDRFKYDQDDSDEEPVYEADKYDIQIMQHRAIMAAKARDQAAAVAQAHAQAQAAQAQAQAQAQRRLQADQVAANNHGPPGVGHTMGSNPGPGAVTASPAT